MQYLDASITMQELLVEARREFIHVDNDNTNDHNCHWNGIHHLLEATAKLINSLFFDQDDDTASDSDDYHSDTDSNRNIDAEQLLFRASTA